MNVRLSFRFCCLLSFWKPITLSASQWSLFHHSGLPGPTLQPSSSVSSGPHGNLGFSISPLLIIISATPQMTLTPDYSQSSAAPSQTVLLSQWLCVVHQFNNLASKITDLFHSILAAHFQGAFLYPIIARTSPDSEILNFITTISN